MHRIIVALAAGAVFGGAAARGADSDPRVTQPNTRSEVRDVMDLLAVARDLPPVVCGLTAQAASGWGWGRHYSDAPSPPLGEATATRVAFFPRGALLLSEISILLDSLTTSNECVRELSVRLLGGVEAELVQDRLLTRFRSGGGETREAVALILGLVRSRAAVAPLVSATRDEDTGVRANSLWALGRIGDDAARAAARAGLNDSEGIVRGAAAGAVGHLQDVDAAQELLRVLRNDSDARVRRAAAWALVQIKASRAGADGLIAALRGDRDAEVREMAAWGLGSLRVDGATAALGEALRRDADEDVRELSAWALGHRRDAASAGPLGDALASDSDAGVRGTAAWALGHLRPSSAPPGLVRAVSDSRDHVRARAAWALAEIRDSSALPALREAFRREQDRTARRAQLRALVRSGERSENFFRELLQSEDASVREAAVRGLAGRGVGDPWPWPDPRPRPFP
jgi:HEAT repeat protein